MDSKRLTAVLSVFLISILTLMLELVQTRIFSVIYWNHLVYFIVTVSLLGIAVSGTVLSISAKIRELPEDAFYTLCFAGFSLSSVLGLYIAAEFSVDLSSFWNTPLANAAALLLSYAAAVVPYFFFGLLVSGTFHRQSERSGTVYFFNLLGSAIGCLAYIALIRPLGANGMVVLISVAGALPLFIHLRGRRTFTVVLTAAAVVAVAAFGLRAVEIQPERNKQYWTWFKERRVEFSQWNAISRVDVVSEEGDRYMKRVLIDGDAQTPLVSAGAYYLGTPLREAVYRLKGKGDVGGVLVIGAGGGVDATVALRNGASSVDAVEINPTTADVISKGFSDFIGNIFDYDNVRLHVEDGRSFVRRSGGRYDVITLFAVDTLGALSTGAYVLSESYLYTLEAFSDYWLHLDDDGMVQIARWYFPGYPREDLRVFTTAYEALAMNGVGDPFSHLLVVADERAEFTDVIISRKPFKGEGFQGFRDWMGRNNLKLLFDPTVKNRAIQGEDAFNDFAALAGGGDKERFYRNYAFNVKPVTDDNPFFFQYGRWAHVFRPYPAVHRYFDSIIGRWPFATLFAMVLQTVVMVAFLVWLPLLKLGKGGEKALKPAPVIIYFALLGGGFMFIEMSMIQKLVLLLGHPVYSMAVTIPTILIAAGLGSLYTDFTGIKRDTLIVIAVLGLAAMIGAWVLTGAAISEAVLSGSIYVRIAASVSFLFPMGFLMGIPFPLGIRSLSERPEMIPIAWAANGGVSVIGSVVAVVLAMQTGFSYVAVIAAVLYFGAMLSFSPLLREIKKRRHS